MLHIDVYAIDAAKRASARSATLVQQEMKRGLSSLATIASTAPWIGLFGTILGIDNSFPGFGTDRFTALAAIAERLSQALVPNAMGLIVGITAMWCYKYLLSEVESSTAKWKMHLLS